MKFIKNKIEKAYKNNMLVCICLNSIVWNNRIIGYVVNMNASDKFDLEIIDEFGQKKNIKTIPFSAVKCLEIGGEYNEDIEKLYKEGFVKNQSKPHYIFAKKQRLYTKLVELKDKKTLCSFIFKSEYSIGIVEEITQKELVIKNIGYNGVSDGISVYDVSLLTEIRYNSNFENRISFLYMKKG